jgi:hypothetical protein
MPRGELLAMTVAERKALPLPEYGELIADWMEMGELLHSNPDRVALVEPSDRTPGASNHAARERACQLGPPRYSGNPSIKL